MIERTDLSYPVYELLKEMILKNQLKPEEKLLQEKLSIWLGLSRTPLLEAPQMLEYDFQVESIPCRGIFVIKLTICDMMDIYEVREGIKCMAVRLCTERMSEKQLDELSKLWEPFSGNKRIDETEYRRADEKFHAMLLEYSGNLILKKTYNLTFLKSRIIQMGLMRSPSEILPEHLNLLAAMNSRDIPAVEQVIRNHLRMSKGSNAVKSKNDEI